MHTITPIVGEFQTPASASGKLFEGLTRLAKRLLGVRVAFVALAGEDFPPPQSYEGLVCPDNVRDGFARGHATQAGEILVVCHAGADAAGRPAADTHVRFYAACPITDRAGNRLGTFCLLDVAPRGLDDEERECLRDLCMAAAAAIERDMTEARLADLSLSEDRMALAIAGSDTGIWDRNVVTGEIHYSPGWKAILGYDASELTSFIEDSYTRLHPDDLDYVRATMQDHFDQKTESYSVEHRIRCKDGSYKWISSRGRVVSRDADGKALRMIGTTTDITVMRALSEKLQQSIALLTNLTNEVPGLVFQQRLLPNGKSFLSYASAGLAEIYALEPRRGAVDESLVHGIIYPEDLPAYRASLAASAASLTPWHLEYRVDLPGQGLGWRQGHARPQRLPDGSTLWHGFITDVTERKRIEAELQGFATIDFLTQVWNRRHFMIEIEAERLRIQRTQGGSAAVLMFDLDHFKAINDTWGHAVGDLALKHFATALRAELRKSDIAGRVGGEEFAAVLRNADTVQATAFARRVQQRLSDEPMIEGDSRIPLTVSIGIAAMNPTDTSVDTSLSFSDMALYRAKQKGRNRIECHEE